MTLTRSQFIERATQLALTVANPIEAIADLVEGNQGFQPEPLPPQPKVVVTFHREKSFKARRLLSNGQWQRDDWGEWVNEDPDPIQRKLAELLLNGTPTPALTFERGKWRRVEETEQPAGLDDISDIELAVRDKYDENTRY